MNKLILVLLILVLSGCSMALDPATIKVVIDEESKREIKSAVKTAMTVGYLAGALCVDQHGFDYCLERFNND